MTYIGCMNQLWRSAMMSPMPASEIALFAYLVNESNKRYWKMPFVCSTTRICDDLRLSRQTVITARKHLAERKLISFIEGKSRHVPSNYSILECTDVSNMSCKAGFAFYALQRYTKILNYRNF